MKRLRLEKEARGYVAIGRDSNTRETNCKVPYMAGTRILSLMQSIPLEGMHHIQRLL